MQTQNKIKTASDMHPHLEIILLEAYLIMLDYFAKTPSHNEGSF